MGACFCFICLAADVSGSATAGTGRFSKEEPWKAKEYYPTVASIHKWISHFVLFAANLIVMTGIARYEDHYLKQKRFLAPLSLMTYCAIGFLCEIAYRAARRKHQVLKAPEILNGKKISPDANTGLKIYSPIAFEKASFEGEPLMILDNLVLNVDKSPLPMVEYSHLHPGGKFTLAKNVGRDISKFFYGGYTLVNPGMHKKNHSNKALSIAETLVVGVLEDQIDIKEQPM